MEVKVGFLTLTVLRRMPCGTWELAIGSKIYEFTPYKGLVRTEHKFHYVPTSVNRPAVDPEAVKIFQEVNG
jgi:hypothetical protein